jgi:voltage-gated potassium channel
MFSRNAFLFGYNKKRRFIARELEREPMNLILVVDGEHSYNQAKEDGFREVRLMDLTDDELLEKLEINDNDYLVCVMTDHYMNVFLTLSLHSIFPKAIILALSDSPHTTQKLKMAGASRIIDLYQVSANRIHNMLHKPVTTKLIERLFSPEEEFSFKEIEIPKGSSLDQVMVDDFDFTKHKVILIGMIDKRLSNQFIFVTSGLENRFDIGDTLVCIGYNEDLDAFEEFIKR